MLLASGRSYIDSGTTALLCVCLFLFARFALSLNILCYIGIFGEGMAFNIPPKGRRHVVELLRTVSLIKKSPGVHPWSDQLIGWTSAWLWGGRSGQYD